MNSLSLVVLFIAAVATGVALWAYLAPQFNTAERWFKDMGKTVRIGHTPFARLFPSLAKELNKAEIERVLMSRNSLVIYRVNGRTVDMVLASRYVQSAAEQALKVMPHVDFQQI